MQAKALESGRESGNVKLASRGLRAFPEELWCWDAPAGANWWQVCAIVKLDLSHNELTDVPEKVGILSVDAVFVRILSTYVQITTLADLQALNISYNKVSSIHPATFTISKLARLNAAHNCIVALPAALCDATETIEVRTPSGSILHE